MKPRIHGRLSALQMPGFFGSSFHYVAGFGQIDAKNMTLKTLGLQYQKHGVKDGAMGSRDQRSTTKKRLN